MNIKKIGLTALAGSLVATSAFAGELSLSGSASISYSDYSGTDAGTTASANASQNWGMDQDMTASGSGELDNGWVVSLSHAMAASGATSNTSSITIDMGDAGSLTYSDADAGGGLAALDDITPTAYEESTDGPLGESQAGMPSGNGFSYSVSVAGASVGISYSDNLSGGTATNDGAVGTGTDNGASHSIGVQYPIGDSGATVYGGLGTESQADGNDIDHTTIGVKATFGAISVGMQRNDEDDTAASSPVDLETTILGVSYMINENLSVSYGNHSTSKDGAVDQDIDSIQAAYTAGGVTVAAYNSKATGVANVANKTSEKTELRVSFAF
jgi:outer membrane protein OmpU